MLVSERRKQRRHPCAVGVSVGTIDNTDQSTWLADGVDISAAGISLVLDRRFEPGALLHLELEIPSEELIDTFLLARVVRVCEHAQGSWLHACQFFSQLPEDELWALLEITTMVPQSGATERVPGSDQSRKRASARYSVAVQRLRQGVRSLSQAKTKETDYDTDPFEPSAPNQPSHRPASPAALRHQDRIPQAKQPGP